MCDSRGDPASEYETGVERAVLQTLADSTPRHAMEIADAVSHHPITVERACARLVERGHIRSLTGGYFERTERGERLLDARAEVRI
ncbi:transcriptional regulator [Haladaptatus sp. GCM10025707]|uniref:transcriptional regulator n=1 Tax=unclassified Haladaptatus TaxID=2622732 RepID=UPI0023E8F781|nr:transcriptional regulator [Haladaptatus sp. QDMS2]